MRAILILLIIAIQPIVNVSAQIQGVPFPIVFDDFHYPNNNTFSGDLTSEAFHGHVLGDNYWLVANSVNDPLLLSSQRIRGWYIRNDWDRTHAPDWLIENKHFLSTDRSKVFRSYPAMEGLDTGSSTGYGTNFMLLGAGPGTYAISDTLISIGSGLAANYGTWVSRVLLYDLSGFKNHSLFADEDNHCNDIDTINHCGMKGYAAPLWLQGSEHADFSNPLPDIWSAVDINGFRKTWPEINFEIFSEYNPANSAVISSGITWPRYTPLIHPGAGSHINPRLGTSGQEGSCYVVSDTSSQQYHNRRDCLEFVTGHINKTGPIFATFIITMTPGKFHHYIIIWDEDFYHNRPHNETGFYPGFDMFIMQTIDVSKNYVPPRWMRVLFDNNVVLEQHASHGILRDNKDMVIDWFLYTPWILTEHSNPSIWDIPFTVRRIRNHLWSTYNQQFASQPEKQIWRVNNTGRALERPSPIMAWNAPNDYILALREFHHPDPSNGTRYYTPEFVGHPSAMLPHANIKITWRVFNNAEELVWVETGRGFVFESPPTRPWVSTGGRIEADVELCNPVNLSDCRSHALLTRYVEPDPDPCPPYNICFPYSVSELPERLVAYNFPNPAHNDITIKFGLPEDGHLQLQLFNAQGSLVETLSSSFYEAGYHEVTLSVSGLANGVYFYQLRSNDVSLSNQVIVVR